jgi:hypothetical protein
VLGAAVSISSNIADHRHYISLQDMKLFEKLATSTGRLAHGLLRSLER